MTTLNLFIVNIRPYLETLYFLSTIVLAVTAIIALRQLSLMKADMKYRATRAAKEHAIAACSAYFKEYIPLIDAFYLAFKEKGFKNYEGPVGDFSFTSLPKDCFVNLLARLKESSWRPALNRLESITALFVTGVADEQTGFDIIGREFDDDVRNQYDILAAFQMVDNETHWPCIIKLYSVWKPRLDRYALERKKQGMTQEYRDRAKELDEALRRIKDTEIPPIQP